MLLSDRELKAALADGRLRLDPLDDTMVQPASIDVRLDRYFRVFANHRYTHIDPSTEQDDLTEVVEPKGDEPFVLHPGEFVLGSTLEVISLADDLASRLEGKALACDTPIWTPEGRTTMGELKPGDRVFDELGRPTVVVAVSEIMLGRPCYEVVTRHGARLVADAQHRWVTSTKHERSRGRGESAVRTTEVLATAVRHSSNELNHHIALAGPWDLPSADLPVDPYVLGVWLGNGTSTTADITSADDQVLEEIARAGYAVEARGGYRYRIGSLHADRRDPVGGRCSGDRSLQGMLRELGVVGNKHVPVRYLTASAAQRLALLQGLMDSDGYIDDRGRCEFVSTKEVLADSTAVLAASLGLRVTRRKKRAMIDGIDCGPAYQVRFVPHIPVFRLARKLARLASHSLRRHHAIQDVRPVASVPVRCIEVDNPRGMFLAGDECIPTHNSSLGRLGLLTHSTAGFIDPGFSGHVTLELSNVANLPITLWPGMKIGQICVFQLSSAAEHPYGSSIYGSRYQGQRGPTPSRSYKSFHRTDVPPAT